MITELDAARLLVYRAAYLKDTGAARVTREASEAKLFATEAACASALPMVTKDAFDVMSVNDPVVPSPEERRTTRGTTGRRAPDGRQSRSARPPPMSSPTARAKSSPRSA